VAYYWEIVVRLRATIFVAAIAFIILSQPTQIIELYLIDIEGVLGRLSGPETQLSSALLAASPMAVPVSLSLFAVLAIWLAGVHLVSLAQGYQEWPGTKMLFANALVLATSVMPLVGIVAGLHLAAQVPLVGSDGNDLRVTLAFYTLAAYAFLATVGCGLAMLQIFASPQVKRLANGLFAPSGILVALLTPIIIAGAVLIWPIGIASAVGTIPLILLFIGVLAVVLASFSHIYQRTGCPLTVIVSALGVAFAILGWNDNHRIDYTDGGPARDFKFGFTQWLQQRGDLAYFADKRQPYPVYIIAAEGGGMAAGYHLATFLAKLQETCPTFAQHIFAISSVSGGSLGAAQFAAQASTSIKNVPWQPCRSAPIDGEYSHNAREFFRADFLSPLVAATLFPDLLQRVIPFPIGALDRARALENAFIARAAEIWGERPNPFSKSVHKQWDPAGSAPVLLLNTTSIEMGARVTISPLVFQSTPTALDLDSLMCGDNPERTVEMPLATSVSLSARAPWITPAGWLEKNDAQPAEICGQAPLQGNKEGGAKRDRLYLVDGGYFENSGLETALEIAAKLRAHARDCQKTPSAAQCSEAFQHGVEIRVIMVFAKDGYAEQFWGPFPDLSSSRPNELWAPLRTLLNTGSARTRAVHSRQSHFDDDYNYVDNLSDDNTIARLDRYRIPGEVILGTNELQHAVLDGTTFFLPLGWRLSRRSMDHIDANDSKATKLTFEIIQGELMGRDTTPTKRPPEGLAN
jgi:hypothetical protein